MEEQPMVDRREFILGGACVAALAMATALRPHKLLTLLDEGKKLTDLIPREFGQWSSLNGGDFVVPKTPGSLSDRLYSETVTRAYYDKAGGYPIMLVIAYGRSQSDLLQLHRPESCYPAIGFTITEHKMSEVAIPPAPPLPSVSLTAQAGDRIEDIVYWTRLAEYFPRTAGEQRKDRLKTAMEGYIGDGALIRASTIRSDEKPDYQRIAGFLSELVKNMRPDMRKSLIGTERATLIS